MSTFGSHFDPPAADGPGGGFATTSTSSYDAPAVRSSPTLLLLATVAVLVAAALILPWTLATSALGYVLAGVVVAVLVSLFRNEDNKKAMDPYYRRSRVLGVPNNTYTVILLVVAWIVTLPHVWVLADTVGRI